MAGGKGTRILGLVSDIPKPLVPIEGKPILEYEIECLRAQGIDDITITVSHMADKIMDYFGKGDKISPSTGNPFGVNISYYVEQQPLGNAGALYRLRNSLDEKFVLLNADSFFDVNINRMIAFHDTNHGLATILVHPNDHPFDSGLIVVDQNDRVVQWLNKEDSRPEFYHNAVNAGIHILSRKALDDSYERVFGNGDRKVDLDRDILLPLAGTGQLYAYQSPEYVKDMGTPERYHEVCRQVHMGLPEMKNLENPQRAIFLDRDGTINKYVGFLRRLDDFELEEGVSDAIRQINEKGYLAIVITNQPVIARGELSENELDIIHQKMETLLGADGAYIDAIYYCPHHPDRGFPGEISELKTKCTCRKPNPGMIFAAAKKYNIDLSQSWMIGDSEVDVETGINAGCHTALIKHDCSRQDICPEMVACDLRDAVNKVLKGIE